jgi:bifunctional non-homologous end joining protein LigD
MAYQREYWHISPMGASATRNQLMGSNFVIHKHKTGKSHFDLRIIHENQVRSWSILRMLPLREGEQRLAIERESLAPIDINQRVIYEQAFGAGKVHVWDKGDLAITLASPQRLILRFNGEKMSGWYELRKMSWYPGNRWLIRKSIALKGTP